MHATIVLSGYHPNLLKGRHSKIQHSYLYLNKYTSTSINFKTDMPAYENFKTIEVNRGNLYYGEPEYLPHYFPPPVAKQVLISGFLMQTS